MYYPPPPPPSRKKTNKHYHTWDTYNSTFWYFNGLIFQDVACYALYSIGGLGKWVLVQLGSWVLDYNTRCSGSNLAMIMSGSWAQHCKRETVKLLLIQAILEQRNRYIYTVRLQIKVTLFSKACNKRISWRVCTRISMRCESPYNGKIVPTVFLSRITSIAEEHNWTTACDCPTLAQSPF